MAHAESAGRTSRPFWSALWTTLWTSPSSLRPSSPSSLRDPSSPSSLRDPTSPSSLHSAVAEEMEEETMAKSKKEIEIREVNEEDHDETNNDKLSRVFLPLSPLRMVVLALWDNIAGPRVEHVWTHYHDPHPHHHDPHPHHHDPHPHHHDPHPHYHDSHPHHYDPHPYHHDPHPHLHHFPDNYHGLDNDTDTEHEKKDENEKDENEKDNADNVISSTFCEPKLDTPFDQSQESFFVENRRSNRFMKLEGCTDPLDIAHYIARYTLGGELVEMGFNTRNTHSEESALPFVDPLHISSSPSFTLHDAYNNTTEGAPDLMAGSPSRYRTGQTNPSPSTTYHVAIDRKIHVFEDSDYFTVSALFLAPRRSILAPHSPTLVDTKHAIAFVIPQAYMEAYQRFHEAISDRLEQIVHIYLYAIQLRPQHAIQLITTSVIRLATQISSLLSLTPYDGKHTNNANYARLLTCAPPPLHHTLFANDDLDAQQVLRAISRPGGFTAPSQDWYGSFESAGDSATPSPTASVASYFTDSGEFATRSTSSLPTFAGSPPRTSSTPAYTALSALAEPTNVTTAEVRERRRKAKAFLATALTSHWQTHNRTIVCGSDVQLVNLFVYTLSLFLLPCDRERSAIAQPGSTYIPDLVVQGIHSHKRPSPDFIVQSSLPTTLVDLNEWTVLQTYPLHEYRLLRRQAQKHHILKLLHLPSKGSLWSPHENIFIPVKHASPIAKRMINECVRLPPYLRLGYITASVRGLMCRALVLIKYVEALTKNTATGGAAAGTVGARATLADGQNVGESDAQGSAPKSPNVTHHSATNVPPNAPHAETLPSDYNVPDTSAPNSTGPASNDGTLYPGRVDLASSQLVRRIRADLDLQTEPCYNALLGLAELLKPGIYCALAGDPASQEKVLIELFESF